MTNNVLFIIDGKEIECTITDTTISIKDSHFIKPDTTKHYILEQLLLLSPEFNEHRTISNMIYEWKTHNILYNWGVAKSHTISVDFELYQNKFLKWCYKVFAKVFKE